MEIFLACDCNENNFRAFDSTRDAIGLFTSIDFNVTRIFIINYEKYIFGISIGKNVKAKDITCSTNKLV